MPAPNSLRVVDIGDTPSRIIQTTRIGIPAGRDQHLPYRFIDERHARNCTLNPLRRGQIQGRDYQLRGAHD